MQTILLPSGQDMPLLGFGTYRLQGKACTRAVILALEVGYTHIDTAAMYGNHDAIAAALKQTGVDRSALFITSKVFNDELRHDAVLAACDCALQELQADYLDLYLIHWPSRDVPIAETMRALAKLQQDGKVRNVGISNFNIRLTEEAIRASEVPVAVNQVEYHPYLNQEKLLAFCKEHNVALTAYCPLARGRAAKDKVLRRIGRTDGKSAAQVALRWLLQKGIITIPKSGTPERIRENFEVFDFTLTDEEMKQIDTIGRSERLIDPGWAEFDD